jgi:hypothetical protein
LLAGVGSRRRNLALAWRHEVVSASQCSDLRGLFVCTWRIKSEGAPRFGRASERYGHRGHDRT